MINRDDIEAGDKVFTRDGGCLVASAGVDGIYVFDQLVQDCWNHDLSFTHSGESPLDIIRIEKAPKPVVKVLWICWDNNAGEYWFDEERHKNVYEHTIKLTIINGKLEKSEQVK